MCLVFISTLQHPEYPLIIAANRDEFYARPTAAANWWTDHPNVLAGRDLAGGGTWMGVTRSGRVAVITNYRDPAHLSAAAPSRGQLVTDFLTGQESGLTFNTNLAPWASDYNGFNLIAGTAAELCYYSNYGPGPKNLAPGFYGLSNQLLDTPWPKVSDGKQRLEPLIHQAQPDPESILAALHHSTIAPDDRLPDTGVGLEWERTLSAMFIQSPNYGTRCSTLLMLSRHGHVKFLERTYDAKAETQHTVSFTFDLQR